MPTVKQAENKLGEGFLSAADLLVDGQWRQFTLKISAVHPANTVRAKNKVLLDRPVLAFEKAKKLFAVSKTVEKLLRYQLGVDLRGARASKAIGQAITIYPVIGTWFGEANLSGIRTRIDADKPKPKIKAKDMGTDITGKSYGLQADPVEVNADTHATEPQPEAKATPNLMSRLTSELAGADAIAVDEIRSRLLSETDDQDEAELIRKMCSARLDQINESESPF